MLRTMAQARRASIVAVGNGPSNQAAGPIGNSGDVTRSPESTSLQVLLKGVAESYGGVGALVAVVYLT